ncbi:hypothetical protein JCM10450v2_008421 [Rhodotorula kratochvilovae]
MAGWHSLFRRDSTHYLPLASSPSTATTPVLSDCILPSHLAPAYSPSSSSDSPAFGSCSSEVDEKFWTRRLSTVDSLAPSPDGAADVHRPASALVRQHRRILALVVTVVALLVVCLAATTSLLGRARHIAVAGSARQHPATVAGSSSLSAAAFLLVPTSPAPPNASFVPSCAPRTWSAGRWLPLSPPLPALASVWTASPALGGGAPGCAQSWFRSEWYLGQSPPGAEPGAEGAAREGGEWPMSGYRRRAAGWRWESGSEECSARVDAPWETVERGEHTDEGTVALLQDLIDRGGWLIAGDSLSEQHFFSLSCVLFPHVRAIWPFPTMSEWQQIKEEHLFLDPASPLIRGGRLRVPDDWDFEGSPLVTHVRTDHGFAPDELVDLHSSPRNSPSTTANLTSLYPTLLSLPAITPPVDLLTDVETFSPPLSYILSLFLRPSAYRNISSPFSPSYAPSTTPRDALAAEARATRSARYRALFFSTGAHYSTRHFRLPTGGGALVDTFALALRAWVARVVAALGEASAEEREGKEVVVRPTSNGHDRCHDALRPYEEVQEAGSSWYSWDDMWRMNEKAEEIVAEAQHPQISFVDIVRPSALRPDAHTNNDCLHLAVGTGVIEGWTRYLAYWLREKGMWADERARQAQLVEEAEGEDAPETE